MHKVAMEMGKWAIEKAKATGFENISSQDWDDLKDCMEVVKYAICADKDYRIVEAMDDAEHEEKFYGRMGYDRWRYADGRFAPKGRGRRTGYTPYLHMMEDEDGMYDEMPYPMTGYRMGYTGGRGENMNNMGTRGKNSGDYWNGDGDGRMGYGNVMKNYSRYGQAYDEYDRRRRHYTETKNPEDKKMMKQSMNEIFSDMENMIENIMEYADASEKPELKQKFVQMAQKVQNMK